MREFASIHIVATYKDNIEMLRYRELLQVMAYDSVLSVSETFSTLLLTLYALDAYCIIMDKRKFGDSIGIYTVT